jgi:CheY-like chemotaxis protein
VNPSAEVSEPPRGRGETVLVAEDTDSVRQMLYEMLVGLGYRVLQASGFEPGKALLQGERVDLLLTDVVMGGRNSGVELARLARQHHPGIRIVLMSGYLEHILPQADSSLYDAVLMKPYRRLELATRIRELLDTRIL